MRFKYRPVYFLIFLLTLGMAIYLLSSPLLWRFFYPFPYRDQVVRYAHENRLDPYLVAAVILVESSFEPSAVSPRGARGLMQIMPSTAVWIAGMTGEDDYNPDMLFDPELNLRFGTWYLSQLLVQFEGNRIAALAAYNAGRGQISEWLSEGIWDGSLENREDIPFLETRNFVNRVEHSYSRYRRIYER